ncbi:MAG: hypothetical protein WKF41_18615 [Gaiellaceae bacterium]
MIVFTSRVKSPYEGPNLELFLINADGSGIRRLTYSPKLQEVDAAWSPDGKAIAFAGYPQQPFGGSSYTKVYVMNADGTQPHKLVDGAGQPAWSPDGRELAYSKLEWPGGIRIRAVDGTSTRRLPDGRNPAWSPDGRKIAYVDGPLWVRLSDGSGKARLISKWGYPGGPTWSSDGKQIVFASEPGSGNGWELYVVDTYGNNRIRLTDNTAYDGAPAWRPATR